MIYQLLSANDPNVSTGQRSDDLFLWAQMSLRMFSYGLLKAVHISLSLLLFGRLQPECLTEY